MLKKTNLSWIITIAILIAFVWYALSNHDMFDALGGIGVIFLVLIGFGKIGQFSVNGLFTTWTVEAFTKKIKWAEGIYIAILSAIGNYFGPLLGGTSIRAIHLKKTHNLSYSNFTSTLMGYYLILFLANSSLALISLLFIEKNSQTNFLMIFFGGIFVFLCTIAFIRLPEKTKLKRLQNNKLGKRFVDTIYEIETGWDVLLKNKRLLIKLGFLAILSLLVAFFVTVVEFRAFDISVGLAELWLYTAIVAMTILISLTPGAIGIREAILLVLSSSVGITGDQVIQIAVVDRGVTFIVLLILFAMIRVPKVRSKIVPENAPI